MAATRDVLAERLQGVDGTVSLLYNRVMENMEYGREKLKDIVEKKAEEEAKEQPLEEKVPEQLKNNNRMMRNMTRFQR